MWNLKRGMLLVRQTFSKQPSIKLRIQGEMHDKFAHHCLNVNDDGKLY
jgi:hypothetical protein